jgi:hypothetical protein
MANVMINPNNIPSNVKIRYIVVDIPKKGGENEDMLSLLDAVFRAEDAKTMVRGALNRHVYQCGGYNEHG